LGKQRSEVLQILRALLGITSGWKNHPVVKMWRGHEASLIEYGFAICDEWKYARGYNDSCAGQLTDLMLEFGFERSNDPPWLGDQTFHSSHRSNLLRKDSVWYGKFGWEEPNDLEYVWPMGSSGVGSEIS
jgi:hypothetical protein